MSAKKLTLAAISLLAITSVVTLVCANAPLHAQSSATDWEKAAGGKMSFEVASVKQNLAEPSAQNFHSNIPLNAADDFSFSSTGGLLSASNQWFTQYLVFAYKLTQYQYRSISKQLPDRAVNSRYDIEARAEGNPTRDQYRLMMQALLADRFKFSAHFEPKEEPVFALIVDKPGKLGPQLQIHPADQSCDAADPSAKTVAGGFPTRCSVVVPMKASAPGHVRFGARNASMALVADWLTSLAGVGIDKPVIDKTGLDMIDFVIEYAPNSRPSANFTPDPNGPAFLEALKDQLGLKLEPQTAALQTFVIDHIEEPSPN